MSITPVNALPQIVSKEHSWTLMVGYSVVAMVDFALTIWLAVYVSRSTSVATLFKNRFVLILTFMGLCVTISTISHGMGQFYLLTAETYIANGDTKSAETSINYAMHWDHNYIARIELIMQILALVVRTPEQIIIQKFRPHVRPLVVVAIVGSLSSLVLLASGFNLVNTIVVLLAGGGILHLELIFAVSFYRHVQELARSKSKAIPISAIIAEEGLHIMTFTFIAFIWVLPSMILNLYGYWLVYYYLTFAYRVTITFGYFYWLKMRWRLDHIEDNTLGTLPIRQSRKTNNGNTNNVSTLLNNVNQDLSF